MENVHSSALFLRLNMSEKSGVWVFNGERNTLPSAVFSTMEHAEKWISLHRVSGVLTWYPLDISVYDWAVQEGCFQPKTVAQRSTEFIGNFSSAYTGHYHYQNGIREGTNNDE